MPASGAHSRALGAAGADRVADLLRLVRIVDSHLRCIRPEIHDLVLFGRQDLQERFAQLDTPMIEGNGNPHTCTLPTLGFIDSTP